MSILTSLHKTKQKKSDRTQDNVIWIQRKKRLKLMKIPKENERKYQSGKPNKCDAPCLDPVMFQTQNTFTWQGTTLLITIF